MERNSSDAMRELIKEDKRLKKELEKLEEQIYKLETSYLQNTADVGNLVRGWADLLSSTSSMSPSQKKRKFTDEDRIFSYSSATAFKSQEKRARKNGNTSL